MKLVAPQPLARACLFFVVVVAYCGVARGLDVISGKQEIGFDRPESWGMKYFASVTLMTGFGPPRALRPGQLRVAGELQWIPEVSDEQRVIGFNGTKSEDLNKLPAIGRLRISIGLPWRLSLTVSYLPPIPINGVEANLLSVSLGRPFRLSRDFTMGLLAYGQIGTIEGAFTCSAAEVRAGADATRNPFGCLESSHDHIWPSYAGLELTASYRIVAAHGLEPYLGVAGNYMNLRFTVDARYGNVLDHTQLATEGATFSSTTGLLFPLTRRLELGSELFYSPLSVKRPQNGATTVEGLLNVRGFVAYRF